MTIYFDADLRLPKKVMRTESLSSYNNPLILRVFYFFVYVCFIFSLTDGIFSPIFSNIFSPSINLLISLLSAGFLCIFFRRFLLDLRIKRQMKNLIFQPGQKQSITLTEDFLLHSFANGRFYTKYPYSSITTIFRREEWFTIYFGKSFIYLPLSVFRTPEDYQCFWHFLSQNHLDNAAKLDVSNEIQNYPNTLFKLDFTWKYQELIDAIMDMQELSYSKSSPIAALQKNSMLIFAVVSIAVCIAAVYLFPNSNPVSLYFSVFILSYVFIRMLPPHPHSTREQLNVQIQKSLEPLGYLEPQCVLVDGSHIVLILTGILCSYPLSQLQKIDNTSRAIVLNLGVYGNVLIPARAFESPEQKQDFLRTLESYLPAH